MFLVTMKYLVVVYLYVQFTGTIGSGANRGTRECNGIGNILKAKGFSYPWWDSRSAEITDSTSANFMQVCPNITNPSSKASKCCPVSFDSRVQKKEMTAAFDKWLTSKLAAAADIFKERKTKFDVTFKSLLARAHTSFHAMFERTYGMLYIQHAHVFHALFTTLEKYYDDGRDPLESKLNDFFSILTKKMFEVLNAQYEFDETYLSCATIAIGKKQGSDLHRQIVSSLRRSFVATRALAQGLQDSEKIITNLQKLQMNSTGCLIPLSQMLHCPICAEQRAFKPCAPFCTSVTSQCLTATVVLSKPWMEFISALEGIIDRLLGPYNVEAVVEPIHIKISEAIMNFQESGPDLSQAVFSDCGKPKLRSRNNRKREASALPSTGKLKIGPDTGAAGPDADLQPSKSLEKLLRETKNRIRKSKSLWDVLPKHVCHAISKDYSSQLCWNGTSSLKPEKTKSNEETSESIASKLVSYQGRGIPSPLVAEQILHLQLITEKLRNAYNGIDVQWTQEIDEDDFGSGMGSGSGDVPTDLEDDDDDDPSGQIRPKITSSGNTNVDSSNVNTKFERPIRPVDFDNKGSNSNPTRVHPNRFDHDDDDDDDDDDSFGINNRGSINRHETDDSDNDETNSHSGGIDFGVFPSTSEPPKFKPTSTTPKTTLGTTTKPSVSNNVAVTDLSKPESTAGKTLAIVRLFTPVFSSMLGKLFRIG